MKTTHTFPPFLFLFVFLTSNLSAQTALVCPSDTIVSCATFTPNLSLYGVPLTDDTCSLNSLITTVNWAQFDTLCHRGVISRTFQAFDCNGNADQCTQVITVDYAQSYFIRFPDDVIATACPQGLYFGEPTFFGADCALMSVSHEDQFLGLPVDGCAKIEREWTIINWCAYSPNMPLIYVPNPTPSAILFDVANLPGPTVSACDAMPPWNATIGKIRPPDTSATNYCTFWSPNPNGYRYKQIIRIVDSTPPTISNCPAAPLVIPDTTLNNVWLWHNVFNPALPSQDLTEVETELSLTATDDCTSTSIWIEFQLFLDLDGDGTTETMVRSTDLGPYPGNLGWNNVLFGNVTGVGQPRQFDNRPVPSNQKWGFALQETTSGIFKTARVAFNTNLTPNTFVSPVLPQGTHQIMWRVEDGCGNLTTCAYSFTIQPGPANVLPVIDCPPNVTVSCYGFDPTLTTYGLATSIDNCIGDTLAAVTNWTQFDTICHRGTITRTFEAVDCNGNSNQCSQQIEVDYIQVYYIRFPDDVYSTFCSGQSYGEPVVLGYGCELTSMTYHDQMITPVPDACIIIERDWQIINWCTYSPSLPLVNVPNPNPNAISNHAANLPGPVVSFCGATPPWNPTIVKISPTDPMATNFCTFWDPTANGYHYTQHIKVLDTEPPVISNCAANPIFVADTTENNPELWHHVFNPGLPNQDLTEVEADLSFMSSDVCTGSYTGNRFQLFLDLDNDGIQESVLDSRYLPGADTIRYNNINTPGYWGGTPLTFDGRPVPTNQKWHFTGQQNTTASQTTASLRWNTALAPTTYVTPQLPRGTHKIKWFVADNCGNETVCEHIFTVQQGMTTGIAPLENEAFALFQNEPNPFRNSTNIRFRLPQPAEAVLSVYNVEGQLLFSKKGDFGQGFNSIQVESEWLRAPGILLYKLESGTRVAWRKMVLVP